MSRPKIYQAGTVSTWCGLVYRVAQPCEIKGGRWKTTLYLLGPNRKPLQKGGVTLCSRKGEGAQDLIVRAER